MSTPRRAAVALTLLLGTLPASAQTPNGPLPGPFPLFPADNWWNLDVSAAPVDPSSNAYINFVGTTRSAHPDFGGEAEPGSDEIYGFPYVVVSGSQPKVQVSFLYDDESDGNGVPFYPIPNGARTQRHWIEGGQPGNVDLRDDNDRHLLLIDADNKHLYELYNVFWDGTKWNAGSGAFFDMNTNNRRPEGWTSADAAGLAILPGLVRYDEVFGPDEIRHAFRVTVRATNGHVYPASHTAGGTSGALPMGARLRLKAGKDISGYAPEVQKIFRAMKTYGLIVADNGSDLYVSGTFDTRWNNDVLNPAFHSLRGSDFEVVQLGWNPSGPPPPPPPPPPVTQAIQFTAPSYQVNESLTAAAITLKRTGGTSGTATVTWEAQPGTAGENDFGPAVTGTVTFGAGVTALAFQVPLRPDTLVEGPETVVLRLTDATGPAAVGAASTAVLTIADDDRGGRFAFSSRTYSVAESGPFALVTVRRTDGAASGVSVAYEATDGTAVVGEDYVATTGVLEFGPGVQARTFVVPVHDDAQAEGPETLNLALVDAGGGAVLGTPATAVLTIGENDATVQFEAAAYSVSEAAANAVVTVRRYGPLTGAVTVAYQTSDGTAEAGTCYLPASGTLTFPSGTAVRSFLVPIVPDTTHEPDETVLLALGPATGATVGAQSTAVLTLRDDDKGGVLQFSLAAYAVAENVGRATIAVTRTLGSAGGVEVSYATSDGTAVAGADYQAVSGTLSFSAGVTKRTFTVPVLPNAEPGGDVTVNLALSGPTGGASLGARSTAVLKILADDPTLQFSQPAFSVGERAGRASIVVRRFGPTTAAVGVDFGTADGTAQAGADYAETSGHLDFGAGVLARTFTVPVLADAEVEAPETVTLSLFGASGGGVVGNPASAVLTIATDNPAIQFASTGSTVGEGAATAAVVVRRLAPATAPVHVDYETFDGTATAGADYTPVSGRLQFAAGVTQRSIVVRLLNDTSFEGPETVGVRLTGAGGGARLGTITETTLTIASNDVAGSVAFEVGAFSAAEGAELATVTVVRAGGAASGVTVDLVASGGSAVDGTDYVAGTTAVTFAAGETRKTVTIELVDDEDADGNRTVGLTLQNPGGGAALGARSTATLWLVDDES